MVLEKLKLSKRRLERVWSRSHSSDDLKNFRSATNLYHAAIIKADNSSLISHWTNFLTLNPSKTEFLVIGLPQQLYMRNTPTIHLHNNVTLALFDSARNLVVIIDKNISFAQPQHISSICKSCFLNIRDLRHIRNNKDRTTAPAIATSFSLLN